MATYLNPGGAMGNPMNLGAGVPGAYYNPGGFMGNPMNLPQPSYGNQQPAAPSPAQQDPLSAYLENIKAAQAKAFGANEQRYNAAQGLVGLDPQGNPIAGYPYGGPNTGAQGSYYSNGQPPPVDRSVNNGVPLTPPTFAGSSPTAAKVNQDAAARGIYNTSGALNQYELGKSTDAFNANMATYQAQNQQAMQKRSQQQQDLDREAQLRQQRLGLLASRNDAYPDASQAAQIAMMAGKGTTEGLSPAAFSSGYGGGTTAAGLGYGLPVDPGYWGGGGGGYYSTAAKPDRMTTRPTGLTPYIARPFPQQPSAPAPRWLTPNPFGPGGVRNLLK